MKTTRQSLDHWLVSFERGAVEVDFFASARRTVHATQPTPSPTNLQHRLLLMLRGSGVCTFRSQRLEMTPGAAVWIQPGVAPRLAWRRRAEVLDVAFTLEREAQAVRLAPDWLYADEAWSLREKLEPMLDELALPMPQSPRRIRWLLGLALTDVMRHHFRRMHVGGLSASQRSRVVRHVSHAGVAPVRVRELAGLLELSEDYFARRFRRTFNQSPRAWLMQQRMLAAGRMLRETSATITEVADAMGYTDLSQFSRQFRRTLGVPPSQYRRA